MNILLLISGRTDIILKNNNLLLEKTEIIKVDDKFFADFKAVLNILKNKKYDAVYYATIDKDLQRFQTFMNFFTFLSGIKKGSIIDEYGKQNKYSTSKLLFKEIPFFAIEILLSLLTLIFYYLKYPLLKWQLIKKN